MIRTWSGLLSVVIGASFLGCGDDPVVPLPSKFIAVQAGLLHSCGILESGPTFCWGANEMGQLGDGSRSLRTTPRLVLGDLQFTRLGLGGAHTCGVTSSGGIYCWGLNSNGQLGDGSLSNRATPGPVTGSLTYQSVTGGGAYNCGVDNAGQVHCWGWNQFGQLGDGSFVDRTTPVAITGGLTFTTVATKAYHSCGLTVSGEVYCWGENENGQLGNGGTEDSATPVRVQTSVTFTSVDVGYYHSCGLGADREVYCWGSNELGQLGLGPDDGTSMAQTPVPALGDLLFSYVSAGAAFTCAIEDGTGAAYCWGFNGSGQVGAESDDACANPNGSPFPCARSPTAVGGGRAFSLVSANTQHVCGLGTDGVAYCWGLGSEGQLGNGSKGQNVRSLEPVRVAGQP